MFQLAMLQQDLSTNKFKVSAAGLFSYELQLLMIVSHFNWYGEE
jgi:hypothetical protein